MAVFSYANNSYASIQVADNLQAIWPSPNNPAYCAQTYGAGWQSLGWDGFSNIQYCAHTLNYNGQAGISLVDDVQAVWPSRYTGANGGTTDCQTSLGSDWQAFGYDGNSNITFCKHFNYTSATPRNFIDGLKSIYPSSGINNCSGVFGSGWQTFGYNGAANTTYCKHFVSLTASASTPANPSNPPNPSSDANNPLPNLTVQLPNGVTATAGTSFSITATIVNNGAARAQTNSWAQIAFSGPGLPAAGQISGFNIPPLEANNAHQQNLYFTPPLSGTYYVGVCADVSNKIAEIYDDDNDDCKTVPINVSGAAVATGNTNPNTNPPFLQNITLSPSSFAHNNLGGITNIQVTFNNPQNYNRFEISALGADWFSVLQNPYNNLTVSSGLNPGTYTINARACNDTTNTCSTIRNAFLTITGQTQGGGNSNQTNQTNTVSTNQPPAAITNTATGINQTSAVLNAAVNPNNNSATAWFEYGTTASLGSQTGSQPVGSSNSNINFSSSISGLQPNTTYYFRAVAQNSYGIARGSILSFTTSFQVINNPQNGSAPLVYTNPPSGVGPSYTTLQGSVNPNNFSTAAWFEYGTTPSLGFSTGFNSVGSGSSFVNFSRNATNLLPNTLYYYRAVAENSGGLAYGNILTLNTGNSYFYPSYYSGNGNGRLPIVATRPASSVFQNVAILNGSAVPNNFSTTAWFEWGPTTSLGNSTFRQTLAGGYNYLDFSNYVTGLTPNTAYYYQAVAENSRGQARGSLLTFRTTGLPQVVSTAVTPAPVISRPTVTPQPLPPAGIAPKVALILTNDKKELRAGDIINLTAVYLNEDESSVRDVSLKISFPEKAEYQNATLAPVSISPAQIEFSIGNLGNHSQGAVNIRAVVKTDAAPEDNLIWNFILDYKDNQNNQHSVSNFVAVKISPLIQAGGFAALLGAGGVWTLFLWLLITALVLSSFYFFYRAIRKKMV